MAIQRGQFSALLAPDIRNVWIETGKERPLEYPLVFNVGEMEWNPLTDRQISGLGTMPEKPEGSQFTPDQPIMGGSVSYEATPYGMAFEVTWEMWRDELYGVMNELARELARSGRNRQEVQAWSILNRAFNNSFAGFDGVSLCNTAHPGLDGTNRSNRPSPDIGFSVTYLQNAIRRFEEMTDERGLPRLMAPTRAVLSPLNKFVAREILGSSNRPFTANNEINALVEEDLDWMVAHFLTTNTFHFLMASKGTHDLNLLWRDRPVFDNFDDPWTKNAVFTEYQRFAEGYGSYRGIDGSTG